MKKNNISIKFVGESATDVTGSCHMITFNKRNLLLDYGLFQDNNILNSYKINHKKIKGLKYKNIDYVFISHMNIDHFGKLPELYHNGCNAEVFIPKNTKELMRIMLLDSLKIMDGDSEFLKRKYGISANPLYSEEDIERCLEHTHECDFNKKMTISEDISVKFISAGHIINSAQIILYLKNGNIIKKIGYTGDIGSRVIDHKYVEHLTELEQVDVLIGECTYSKKGRPNKSSDREKDREKLECVINQSCIEKKSKVLIPVFSLDRLETILTEIYYIYGNDKEFKIPIIIDTPLGIKIYKLWSSIIDKDKELWNNILNWENVKLSDEWSDSLIYQNSSEPMIILASSGMCNAGRSVAWAKKLLPNSNSYICFCGYSSSETLATKIKDGKKNKVILIEGEKIPNKCGVISLFSFSSHMCHDELIDYYTSVQYNKLYLVHSDFGYKALFTNELIDELSKKNKTSKVCCVNEETTCYL